MDFNDPIMPLGASHIPTLYTEREGKYKCDKKKNPKQTLRYSLLHNPGSPTLSLLFHLFIPGFMSDSTIKRVQH